jgi:hypothetical protein
MHLLIHRHLADKSSRRRDRLIYEKARTSSLLGRRPLNAIKLRFRRMGSSTARVAVAASLSALVLWTLIPFHSIRHRHALASSVWDSIYVVHLPSRTDRHARMLALSTALDLRLTFHPATLAASNTTQHILEHVRREREAEGWCLDHAACSPADFSTEPGLYETRLPLDFNSDVLAEGKANGWQSTSLFLPDAYLSSTTHLDYTPSFADLWAQDATEEEPRDTPVPVLTETGTNDILRDKRKHAFVSYDSYNQRRRFDPGLTVRVLPLSKGEASCWHSHTDVMRRFLASGEKSTLIVEDDVDVEWDLKRRVEEIWSVLPKDYDVVRPRVLSVNNYRDARRTGLPWTLLVPRRCLSASERHSAFSKAITYAKVQPRLRAFASRRTQNGELLPLILSFMTDFGALFADAASTITRIRLFDAARSSLYPPHRHSADSSLLRLPAGHCADGRY